MANLLSDRRRRRPSHAHMLEPLEPRTLLTADLAGNSLAAARAITVSSSAATYTDWVGGSDANDYYRFTLAAPATVSTSLSNLAADADLQLVDAKGKSVVISQNRGKVGESITRALVAGTYGIRVYRHAGNTNYTLQVAAIPTPTQVVNPVAPLKAPVVPAVPNQGPSANVGTTTTAGGSTASKSTSTTPAPTGAVVAPPVSVTQQTYNTYTELDITGTDAADAIGLTQSGGNLTLTANGRTTKYPATFGEIVIHGGAGDDVVTVDSSLTLNCRIYGDDGSDTLTDKTQGRGTLVSIGGGQDVDTGSAGTGIWADNTDKVSGAMAGIQVHIVTGFYQPFTNSAGSSQYIPLELAGQNLPDPTDSGAEVRLTHAPLWGTGPVMGDVNQGAVGDCYFLSALAGLAYSSPVTLMQLAVDLGDGTYAVQFSNGGTRVYVRVDGDVPTGPYDGLGGAQPGASGAIWAPILEKAYAFVRSGANTYASLNTGWMGDALRDLGIANTWENVSVMSNSFVAGLAAQLASGQVVTMSSNQTVDSSVPVVASHCYTVLAITRDPTWGWVFTLRNPWGVDGAPNPSNLNDGIVQFSGDQIAANFDTVDWTI